ncbi:MAG: hypothetical protein HRU17_20595, partial [Polyangiaceae bacterium]|nr:hypothetical protein [Polyangiaceae bacterium]
MPIRHDLPLFMNSGEWLAGDVATEFDGSELGDPRRERRLKKIASKL